MTTTAEQIAALLGNDGQTWETEDGESLDDLAAEHGGTVERHAMLHHLSRYAFADGSAIVICDGGAWDIEGFALWSWVSDPDRGEMCLYCGGYGPEECDVPAASDDDAWDRIATEHEPWCEWVYTRAHRIHV